VWGGAPPAGLLVDVGLSYRQTLRRMAQRDIDPYWFRGVLITHYHGDHVSGIKPWVEHHGTPVYCTRETADKVEFLSLHDRICVPVETRREWEIAGFAVRAVPVIHNAEGACTFFLREIATGQRLALIYETGRITKELAAAAADADVVLLESNHDHRMLADNDKLPGFLVERIASTHLSNVAAGKYLETLPESARLVILLHLSSENNHPDLALKVASDAIARAGRQQVPVLAAPQDAPTEVLEV
jgi:phosphoribosyl 1,2-cyclic phosphodiesterase